MDNQRILETAQKLLTGEISADQFLAFGPEWCSAQVDDSLADATLDIQRRRRCGFPEVVYGEGKSPDQLVRIVDRLSRSDPNVLVTRVSPEQAQALGDRFGALVHYSEVARTARVLFTHNVEANAPQRTAPQGHVCVITAGTTDIPVAEEARETLTWMNVSNELIPDVGVAGPHRLLAEVPRFRRADALVVAAGMEGALPSVVAGHVACPIFAVPTSVGYGMNLGGIAPLLSMLNSCAANVAVVNINAGFKAGYLAGLVASQCEVARRARSEDAG